MGLNTLVLATVFVHASIVLYQFFKHPHKVGRAPLFIPALLFCIIIIGWFFFLSVVGYVVAVPWLLLVIFPIYADTEVRQATRLQQWDRVARWAGQVARLRPFAAWKQVVPQYTAIHYLYHGNVGQAVEVARQYKDLSTPVGSWFRAQFYNLEGMWPELLTFTQQQGATDADAAQWVPFHLRALGELHHIDTLIATFHQHLPTIERMPASTRTYCFAMLFAFTGRPSHVEDAADTLRSAFPPYTFPLWLGTAKLVAGETAAGKHLLVQAETGGDTVFQKYIEERIARYSDAPRHQIEQSHEVLLEKLVQYWRTLISQSTKGHLSQQEIH